MTVKLSCSKNSFRNTISVINSVIPDWVKTVCKGYKLPLARKELIRVQLSRNIVGLMSLLGIIVNHVISKLQTTIAVHPCSLISKIPIHDLQNMIDKHAISHQSCNWISQVLAVAGNAQIAIFKNIDEQKPNISSVINTRTILYVIVVQYNWSQQDFNLKSANHNCSRRQIFRRIS